MDNLPPGVSPEMMDREIDEDTEERERREIEEELDDDLS